MRIATELLRRGAPIVDVNIEDNVFSGMAETNGVKLRGPAASVLPELVQDLLRDST